ncbi:acyltransferase family protein [Phycicoccus avicenniae]|uniref:acyltransferase family protein n=1 Tax=Phycicoccus avicenniae TaxID=2828860 RepID=UPI003D26B2BD
MTTATSPGRATRVQALDGLRGVTIVLVVLGHLSAFLWPEEGIRSVPYLRGLVGGGAVPVFFVVSGFIVTSGLLRDVDRDTLDPLRFLLRRVIRVGAQLVPLCAAVAVVAALDPTDTTPADSTVRTLTNTLTFTNNWLYALNPLGARNDMGHLWFLSIQQQWYVVLPLLLLALATRRRLLAAVLVALAAASSTYRLVRVSDQTWFALAVDTFARADALLLGAALAVALPWLRGHARYATPVATAAMLALLGLLLLNPELGPLAFLQWWGVVFSVVAVVLVGAVVLHEQPSALTRGLAAPWLTWLGRASLVIYVWHYPVIFFVGRHATGSSWLVQTVVVLAIVAGLTVASNRWVEDPVRRWLATHLRPPRPAGEPLPSASGTVAP